MNLDTKTRKEVGALGEKVAAEYLRRHGLEVLERNVVKKLGELDIVARSEEALHFVEVKTILCDRFPSSAEATEGQAHEDAYDPSLNLHEAKIRKVARMGEWYVAEHEWDGEWQVDGILVWLRRADGQAKVRYLPQIV